MSLITSQNLFKPTRSPTFTEHQRRRLIKLVFLLKCAFFYTETEMIAYSPFLALLILKCIPCPYLIFPNNWVVMILCKKAIISTLIFLFAKTALLNTTFSDPSPMNVFHPRNNLLIGYIDWWNIWSNHLLRLW